VAGVIALAAPAQTAWAGVDVGQPAPPLVVEEFDGGQTFDLSALQGHVVILNFWATWCPPCRQEMPTLDAFYRLHHPEGLEMIGLSVGSDRSRDRADVRDAMQGIAYPAAMLKDATRDGFGTPSALPLTVVIDTRGRIAAKLTSDEGRLTQQHLADVVLPLLAAEVATPIQGGSGDSAAAP